VERGSKKDEPMILYEQMTYTDLVSQLKEQQEYYEFLQEFSPNEGYLIEATKKRIDKLQKILKSYE